MSYYCLMTGGEKPAQMPQKGYLLCFASIEDAEKYRATVVAPTVPPGKQVEQYWYVYPVRRTLLAQFTAITLWEPSKPLTYRSVVLSEVLEAVEASPEWADLRRK